MHARVCVVFACVWVCEKDSRSTFFINFVKYAHTKQQKKWINFKQTSNAVEERAGSGREAESEREREEQQRHSLRASRSRSPFPISFPLLRRTQRRPSLPACPATWNWNFPALECFVLLLLLFGRLCCTRTTDNQRDWRKGRAANTRRGKQGDRQTDSGETKRKKKKILWQKGMGVDFIFFLYGCCFLLALCCVCVVLFFLFTLCFRLSTRFWFCVFLCATYAFRSLFRSLFPFACARVRRSRSSSGSDATVAA